MQLIESINIPSLEYRRNNPGWRNYDVHKWSQRTGIEIIYDEISIKKLEDIWKNWNKMPDQMKEISDQKSIELYGINNKSHFEKSDQNRPVGFRRLQKPERIVFRSCQHR